MVQGARREGERAAIERLTLEDTDMIDLNKLAQRITKREGLKQSLSIAQVKEVLAITLGELAKMSPEEVEDTLSRYRIQEQHIAA